jgi:hypothetical protein
LCLIHIIPQILWFSVSNTFYSRYENYDRERRILNLLDNIKENWKRGIWAVAIFIAVWLAVFFIAFMTAFGNDTPLARTILGSIELFTIIANPLWGIPLAFLIGIYSKRK